MKPEEQTLKQFIESTIAYRLRECREFYPEITRQEAAYGLDIEGPDLFWLALTEAAESGRCVSRKSLDCLPCDRLAYFLKRYPSAVPAGYITPEARRANKAAA